MPRSSISSCRQSAEHDCGVASVWADVAGLITEGLNGISGCEALLRQPDAYAPDVIELVVGPVTLRFGSRTALLEALEALTPRQTVRVSIAS